jgi:hypothetical protein
VLIELIKHTEEMELVQMKSLEVVFSFILLQNFVDYL